ncbi:MAG: hypothetical protein ACREL9_14730 [Gemmatimonadales bacterium]
MSRRAALPVLLLLAACDRSAVSTGPDPASAAVLSDMAAAAAPAPLVTVPTPTGALELWPFTGADFSAAPQDPVNLIFAGRTDPRGIRAALMMLGGDRTAFGFPDAFPFNCVWKDGIGGVQTAFGTASGWVGSAIQLECGDYGPIRFHVRLFGAGPWTLANVHFELLIPGTTEHQVLSWELAEQLVLVDFLRSGLLVASVPLFPTDPINPSPYRAIPAVIYNGIPVELRATIGGPLGAVSDAVPIASDGRATVLNLAGAVAGEPIVARQDFVIDFSQVIPRPFCTDGPSDFLYVQGPVRLRQQVVLAGDGGYRSRFHALGDLDVTPVDVSGGVPVPAGPTQRARVVEQHQAVLTDAITLTSSFQLQVVLPLPGAGRDRLRVQLVVGPGASSRYALEESCAP